MKVYAITEEQMFQLEALAVQRGIRLLAHEMCPLCSDKSKDGIATCTSEEAIQYRKRVVQRDALVDTFEYMDDEED